MALFTVSSAENEVPHAWRESEPRFRLQAYYTTVLRAEVLSLGRPPRPILQGQSRTGRLASLCWAAVQDRFALEEVTDLGQALCKSCLFWIAARIVQSVVLHLSACNGKPSQEVSPLALLSLQPPPRRLRGRRRHSVYLRPTRPAHAAARQSPLSPAQSGQRLRWLQGC